MKSHCECLSVKRVDVGCSHLHTSTVCSKQTNRLHFFPHFISHFDSFEIREWMQKWSMGGSDREWAGCMEEGVVKHKNIYKKLEEKQKQTKFLHLIRYSGQPTNALILQRIETHTHKIRRAHHLFEIILRLLNAHTLALRYRIQKLFLGLTLLAVAQSLPLIHFSKKCH